MNSDHRTSARAIPGYLRSVRRTPSEAALPLRASVGTLTGPVSVLEPEARSECDISRADPGGGRALGQLIKVTGRVLDEFGRPVSGALIEFWQANAAGRYIHKNDQSAEPIDPNFRGVGRVMTDAAGRFRINTIKPGGYAVPHEGPGSATGWWRPPHIHFSLFGTRFTSRLITQMYFPGEPLNDFDLLLNSIPDPAARGRMVGAFDPSASDPSTGLCYRHDFVLAGARDTVFEGG